MFGYFDLPRIDYDISIEEIKELEYDEFEVDLHELFADQALNSIRRIVKHAPEHVKNIYVIHGYIGGTVLKNAITKNNLRSSRIRHINPTYNKGQSVIVFKSEDN